jgi:hypothetical protein
MRNKKLILGTGVFAIGAILAWAAADDPPTWWTTAGVLGTESPTSPANLGQVKNMAAFFHTELAEVLPNGAGFDLNEAFPPPPPQVTLQWYAEQYQAANLGQLKFVASHFYERLNELAPDWLAEQMALNDPGLSGWPHPVPWDPATPVAENYAPSNLGQLKLVFSLRIDQDLDNDGVKDLLEHIFYGNITADDTTTDYDRDGLSDRDEILIHLTSPFLGDTDGDGFSDGTEISLGLDPLVDDHPTDWAAQNACVLTPTY